MSETADDEIDVDRNSIPLATIARTIPPEYQSIFEHEQFNKIQSIVLPQILDSRKNIVVAAPTGSGKTVIHELAILHHLIYVGKKLKCVFIAPNKALCQQRMRDWERKFSRIGLTVLEVTGDVDLRQGMRMIAMASIIITTPEKWDSITRIWKNHVFLLGAIDLLLLDEIHHLGEERGATLEALVVRMRMLSCVYASKKLAAGKSGEASALSIADSGTQSSYSSSANASTEDGTEMRVIALSATLPNLVDIGTWLNCEPACIHYFDDSFRPVPLETHTLAMGQAANPFLFERSLDERVPEVIRRYSEGKQVLIFCSTKKGTEALCGKLSRQQSAQVRWSPQEEASLQSLYDPQLRSSIRDHGIAFHHGGLSADDRTLVEQMYLCGRIQLLCCTSTLAHGVNLPAHLVIVKGTNCWRGGSRGYERINKSDIIQMLGRAGRPGFDERGVAVIMTSAEDKLYYESISLHADVVESTLRASLIEAICAEISQNVICSMNDCVAWMQKTYFYVRVCKEPAKYGFKNVTTAKGMEDALQQLCSGAIHDLSSANIVSFDGDSVKPSIEASIMTKYLIKFNTMDQIMKLPMDVTLSQMLQVISGCAELLKPVRRSEKKLLNDVMKTIRFPLKVRVQEPEHKSYVLLQAAIARMDSCTREFSLKVEQAEIVESTLRILAALAELSKERSRGSILEKTILLDRALRVRMWESGFGSIFFQCTHVSDAVKSGLLERGVRTLGDVEGLSPRQVEQLARCSSTEAGSILQLAAVLRRWQLDVRAARSGPALTVEVFPAFQNQSPSVEQEIPLYQLLCFHIPTGQILCYRRLERGIQRQTFSVPFPAEMQIGEIRCALLSDYIGIDGYQIGSSQQQAPTPKLESPKKKKAPLPRAKERAVPKNSASQFLKPVIDDNTLSATVGANEESGNNIIGKYLSPLEPQWDSSFADHIDRSIQQQQQQQMQQKIAARLRNTQFDTAAASTGSSKFDRFQYPDTNRNASMISPSNARDPNVGNEVTRGSLATQSHYSTPVVHKNANSTAASASTLTTHNDTLRTIRSKAVELKLDSMPVKRLRNHRSSAWNPSVKIENSCVETAGAAPQWSHLTANFQQTSNDAGEFIGQLSAKAPQYAEATDNSLNSADVFDLQYAAPSERLPAFKESTFQPTAIKFIHSVQQGANKMRSRGHEPFAPPLCSLWESVPNAIEHRIRNAEGARPNAVFAAEEFFDSDAAQPRIQASMDQTIDRSNTAGSTNINHRQVSSSMNWHDFGHFENSKHEQPAVYRSSVAAANGSNHGSINRNNDHLEIQHPQSRLLLPQQSDRKRFREATDEEIDDIFG